jgi:hypothetical protein
VWLSRPTLPVSTPSTNKPNWLSKKAVLPAKYAMISPVAPAVNE